MDEIISLKTLLEPKEYLPAEPVANDLLPYLAGRMRTKRLRKKFIKRVDYYLKRNFVIGDIKAEWHRKKWQCLGHVLAEAIYTKVGQKSFVDSILISQPICS